MKFTSCKHRLKHISCIHRTICFSCTYYRVQLVDKEDYLTLTLFYFLKNSLKSFLKLASVFCTCNKCSHIKSKYLLIFKFTRHIASHDTLCKSLNCCRFADTRFTDKYRIVFIFSRKNTDNIPYLAVPANNRVHLSLFCPLDKVSSVFFKCIISCLRIVTCHTLVSPDL